MDEKKPSKALIQVEAPSGVIRVVEDSRPAKRKKKRKATFKAT